jgi:hypothetical protein
MPLLARHRAPRFRHLAFAFAALGACVDPPAQQVSQAASLTAAESLAFECRLPTCPIYYAHDLQDAPRQRLGDVPRGRRVGGFANLAAFAVVSWPMTDRDMQVQVIRRTRGPESGDGWVEVAAAVPTVPAPEPGRNLHRAVCITGSCPVYFATDPGAYYYEEQDGEPPGPPPLLARVPRCTAMGEFFYDRYPAVSVVSYPMADRGNSVQFVAGTDGWVRQVRSSVNGPWRTLGPTAVPCP